MVTKKTSPLNMISVLIFVFLCACSNPPEPATNYSSLKIAPPPNGGIYLGQHEWRQWESPDDIETFEAAVGRKVALFSVLPMAYDDSGLSFQPEIAEEAWQKGKMVSAHGLGASPMEAADNKINGFTVDRLLKGEFDDKIHQLALQFKQFGKPMFFFTTREPNGIGQDWFGGFGINGDKNFQWAIDNKKGLAEFDPSGFPNAQLYADLGDPQVSDGVERLKAAHRYYYDFFTRREKIDFLTFDGMGWATILWQDIANGMELNPGDPNYQLIKTTFGYEYFYPGDEYIDWVSITWYMAEYEGAELPNEDMLQKLRTVLNEIKNVAPEKPVIIIEMGFGIASDTQDEIAEKVTAGLTELIKHPQVNAFAMWSQSSPEVDPFNFLIRPNTPEGEAFKKVIDDNPDYFHSCIYFSDGSQIPTCKP